MLPIIFISAVCCGLVLLREEGMLLEKVYAKVKSWFTYDVERKTYDSDNSVFVTKTESRTLMIFKPIWGCVMCMVSVWGTITYWIGADMGYWSGDWFGWVVSCLGASFLNGLLWNIFDK